MKWAARYLIGLGGFVLMVSTSCKKERPTPPGIKKAACKQTASSLNIKGGEVVSDHRPVDWMVNIRGGSCGGTLISPSWVLTAAHCYAGKNVANGYILWGGDHNLRNGTMQRIEVKRFIRHPQYKNDASDYGIEAHDLALLELAKPVAGIKFFPSIPKDRTKIGENLRVLGWGDTVIGSVYRGSAVLKSAWLTVLSHPNFAPNKMQLGNRTNQDAIGNGDSGGPALRMLANGSVEQVGITSTGNDQFGFFTETAPYRDWIYSTSVSPTVPPVVLPPKPDVKVPPVVLPPKPDVKVPPIMPPPPPAPITPPASDPGKPIIADPSEPVVVSPNPSVPIAPDADPACD